MPPSPRIDDAQEPVPERPCHHCPKARSRGQQRLGPVPSPGPTREHRQNFSGDIRKAKEGQVWFTRGFATRVTVPTAASARTASPSNLAPAPPSSQPPAPPSTLGPGALLGNQAYPVVPAQGNVFGSGSATEELDEGTPHRRRRA